MQSYLPKAHSWFDPSIAMQPKKFTSCSPGRNRSHLEVTARTGSYAEAGTELGLTHGAVSRQIALMETRLGQRLFVRTGRRMTATQAARAFAAEVSLSFDRMTAAAEACGHPSARHVLRVSAPIPRPELFHGERPEVEVAVTTTTTLHEELRGGFDVAIRRGPAERGA
jgi:LysR family transcriptional regulator, glycine cleavage system transcriptional activator